MSISTKYFHWDKDKSLISTEKVLGFSLSRYDFFYVQSSKTGKIIKFHRTMMNEIESFYASEGAPFIFAHILGKKHEKYEHYNKLLFKRLKI